MDGRSSCAGCRSLRNQIQGHEDVPEFYNPQSKENTEGDREAHLYESLSPLVLSVRTPSGCLDTRAA
jgi:hypothetical protein